MRCALVQAIDTAGLHRRRLRRLRRAVERPVLARPGRLPRGHRAARVRPRGGRARRSRRGRPPTARWRSTTRRRPTGTTKAIADYLQQAWGEVGVDVTQTTIEQSVLITNALLGAPEFWPSAGATTPASSSTARTTGGTASPPTPRRRDGRRRAVAELRPPQRPGDQRPARPGPRTEPTPPSARRSPRRSTGSSPSECWILPTYADDVGHPHAAARSRTSAARRCPTVASCSTAPASPARSG